jgi:hypothetical protein
MEQRMAYFAKLDENNVVVEVLVVDDNDIQNLSFPESEEVGIAFLNSFLPAATWKQSVENLRFKPAAVGDTFHPECGEFGGFAAAKLADDFVWDASTCSWATTIPYPTDGHDYYWNFEHKQWSPAMQPPPPTVFIG